MMCIEPSHLLFVYFLQVPGCLILVGDTHAAQGDSELAGTAMETSMTAKMRVTLHKASEGLPKLVSGVDWPLLETKDEYVVHGFAYTNYLDELPDPSTIFQNGTSIDAAMEDCFYKTRNWLMDAWDLLEEETIVLMTTSIDFGVTQVVDGNCKYDLTKPDFLVSSLVSYCRVAWSNFKPGGAHASIPKFVFDDSDAPYDYSCTTSMTPGSRHLKSSRRLKDKTRRALYEKHSGNKVLYDQYSEQFYTKMTKSCKQCADSGMRRKLTNKLLDAKLSFL